MSTNGNPVQDLPIWQPPLFCEYAGGPCDQSFESIGRSHGIFLYPSTPEIIASTIDAAVQQLSRVDNPNRWTSWKHLGIAGQIIFCEICKALRFTEIVVADVTTLNFNLLFEIGYALGLDLPVVPIRDTSFIRDQKTFDELGLLDTIGYVDFQNSAGLVQALLAVRSRPALAIQKPLINKEQPLYLMKSHVQTEGMVKRRVAVHPWMDRSSDKSWAR